MGVKEKAKEAMGGSQLSLVSHSQTPACALGGHTATKEQKRPGLHLTRIPLTLVLRAGYSETEEEGRRS